MPLIGFGCKTVTHMAHPVPAWACKCDRVLHLLVRLDQRTTGKKRQKRHDF